MSCLGGTNTGFLRVPPSCEVGTLYDTDGVTILEENHFNSWNSQLWRRVRNTFSVDLENMYRTLRSNGLFTLENMFTYFDAVTDIISPKMYNDSQQIKYIAYDQDGTDALHGNRKLQIRKWLRERIAYLDSKYGYYAGGGVGENYCNFRMNYQGAVSLDLTTYYTVYAKVRWATNNEQTIRIARGQKKTFSYYSDVGTDREVMIFLPESLKTIENISKIYPNSIDVSKATKLTQIEAHNSNLFSVDLSKNKYLRKIDFNGCARLGTETATMTLNFCKYLTKVDLRGTQITAVNFNTKGGSLKEIYYPKSIQSVTLINQLLLTDMILPHGENGENIPSTLSSVDIQNCPNIIKTVDLTSDPTSLQGMKNCRNLTLNNSIMLERFNFYGFTRLANVNLQNMETLKEIDFLNMTEVGQETSLRYIGVSACPNLTRISMNCDDPNYEITWANNSLLDLQTAGAVEEISSNCIIKGLETIVLPRSIKGLYFTDEYGTGYSDLKNIWAAESCTVIKTGVFPEAQHLNSEGVVDDYTGIDFKGLNIANIDLGALVQIPKAINFSLYPTHVNPNFNLNRDGETLPYLQPIGILDLSNYTESLAKFFDGVDLDKLRIICNKEIPQKDFSYCFYNSSFSDDSAIDTLLSKATGITNLDYCFYKTTVRSTDILNEVRMGNNSTMNYTFAECPNITSLEGVTIPNTVTEVEGMFYGCPLTSVRNITVNVRGSISGLFKGCSELLEIRTMKIPNVTNVSSVFEGCSKLSLLTGFELPDSCTDVSNLFNGCYSLLDLTINLSDNITRGDNWFPPNLESLYDSNINNPHSKLTDCSTLKTVSNLYINGGDFSDMFNGCSSLSTLDVSMGTNITSLARFLKGCSKITFLPLNEIGNSCKNIEEIFRGTKITSIDDLVFGTGITNATNWAPTTLKEANNVTIKNNYTNFKNLTNLNTIANLTISNNVTSLKDFCSNCPSLIDFEFAGPVSSINYNITSCENAFNGCTSLTNFDIPDAILANTTNISGMFKNCSSLNASPISGINDKITNISYLFNGSSISDLKSFTFGSNINTYELWEPSVSYSIRNSTIKTSIKLFRNSLKVKYIDGLVINSNVTDISYYFEGCTSLVEDFAIPTHIMDCSYCFYNCTGITHIYANWNNRYNRNMLPTNCYAGCTGITHIDNNYVISYNGDSGLGYVHKDWGGFGFEFDYTSIYEVTIPNDNYTIQVCSTYNNLTLPFDFQDLNIIDYGDGTYWSNPVGSSTTTIPTHTYVAAGVYYIKGNYVGGMNAEMPSSMKTCVTKVLRVAGYISRYSSANDMNIKSIPDRRRMFSGLSNLTSVNITNLPLDSSSNLEYFFANCSSLNEDGIIGLETIDFTKVVSMKHFFARTGVVYLDLTSINTSNVINFQGCFNNCNKLISINGLDLSTWTTFTTSNVNNMASIFAGCSNLEAIYDFHINIANQLTGTNFIAQEYWIITGWKMFAGLNKLIDIQCHGVLTDYPTLNIIYLFSGFNHRNLTEESWLSLISMLGPTSYTKTVYFNYLSSVPSYVIEDLTNKGYSVAQG